MTFRLALCMEKEYGRRFLERVGEKGGLFCEIVLIDGTEKEWPEADYFLCDEDNCRGKPKERIILLTEGPQEQPRTIHRYQPFGEIYDQLLRCLNSPEQAEQLAQKPFHLVVLSVSGGCSKNVVALGLSELFSTQGFQTLYLNLDPLDLNDQLLDSGMDNGFSQLFLHQNTPEKQTTIHRYFTYDTRHRFRFLSSPDHFQEKLHITCPQWQEALTQIHTGGLFQVVVTECVCAPDALGWQLMQDADYIILTGEEAPYDRMRRELFLQQLQGLTEGKLLLEKMLEVTFREEAKNFGLARAPKGKTHCPQLIVNWEGEERLYLAEENERVFDPAGKGKQNIKQIYKYIAERMIQIA